MPQLSNISPELHKRLQEKTQAHEARMDSAAQAGTNPVPGALAGAFLKGPIEIGEYSVRKVVAADWLTLRAIESPLIQMMAEWQANPEHPKEVKFEDRDEWAICWLFTKATPKEGKLFSEKGKDSFLKQAEDISLEMDGQLIQLILFAVIEQIRRNWTTALKYKADLETSGEITFFQDAGETLKTASAGGSTT